MEFRNRRLRNSHPGLFIPRGVLLILVIPLHIFHFVDSTNWFVSFPWSHLSLTTTLFTGVLQHHHRRRLCLLLRLRLLYLPSLPPSVRLFIDTGYGCPCALFTAQFYFHFSPTAFSIIFPNPPPLFNYFSVSHTIAPSWIHLIILLPVSVHLFPAQFHLHNLFISLWVIHSTARF